MVADPYRSPPAPPPRAPRRQGQPCPRCAGRLVAAEVAGVALESCDGCDGRFVAREAMVAILDHPGTVDELRALLPRRGAGRPSPDRLYINCPVCGTLMHRRQSAPGGAVVIDWCALHGCWFDAGELPRALDFVAAGGDLRWAAR